MKDILDRLEAVHLAHIEQCRAIEKHMRALGFFERADQIRQTTDRLELAVGPIAGDVMRKPK